MQARQCRSKTKFGARCQANAGADGLCYFHSPSQARTRARARRCGGLARVIAKATQGKAAPVIANVGDVLGLVNDVIADVWLQENTAPRARALLAAAAQAIQCLQIGDLENRVKALEDVLKMRGDK